MDNEKIARELISVAKELMGRDKIARGRSVSYIVKDFLSRIDAHFNSLMDSRHRLEMMQFQEVGVGGRVEDESISENIERIDGNLEVLDDIVDYVKSHYRRLK